MGCQLSISIAKMQDNTNQDCRRRAKRKSLRLEYTTSHTPQLNKVIERRSTIIKEGALSMLLNAKINYTSQKCCMQNLFIRSTAQETVGITRVALQVQLKFSMEKNRRSLVSSWSLGVLVTSINSKSLRSR